MLAHLSIKWRLLAIATAGPLLVALIMGSFLESAIERFSHNGLVEKSRAIVIMAESARNEMGRKLEAGIIAPFESIPRDKLIQAVPVITAINMARENAAAGGYQFRVPKISPRNPENTPTPLEREVLLKMEAEHLDEHIIVEPDQTRFFRAIRLTDDCLACHGDPKGARDPLGGTMEGWKTGELHGAFEIISSHAAAQAAQNRALATTAAWTGGILLLVFMLGWRLLQTFVIIPLCGIRNVARQLAAGDLTARLEGEYQAEMGTVAQALADMIERLTEVIGHVMDGATNLASSSTELSSTSQSISRGAVDQASAVEEISSSMEEMSSNIAQTAENAKKTDTLAQQSAQEAEESGEAVRATVSAMQQISEKISIVEEIARQTNLLALNAAIEAARAGEHGKGFAVVAAEVRKLAERSGRAASEISQLSSSSMAVADKAGRMLLELVPTIKKTAELVQEITAATNEQHAGVEQINQAIQQLDQVIQANASASEEMSSTSEELAAQANQLQLTISFFQLEESSQPVRRTDCDLL
ncbi:methyl-accepting chemotaxis protein [Megalodesulfovibrio paquesii]